MSEDEDRSPAPDAPVDPGPPPAPDGPTGAGDAATAAEAPSPAGDVPSPGVPAGPAAPAAEPAPEAKPAEAKAPTDLKRILEALLFASDAPLAPAKIREAIPRVNLQAVKAAADQLRQDYEQAGHAFELVEIAEGYQLLTRPAYDEWITRMKKAKSQAKLSGAALETLAIIAYKQPIRRIDIEAIRGVQSGELVRALMERGLIRIAGRADQPGSPLLYGTTKDFLDVVGLKSLEELPKPEEVK